MTDFNRQIRQNKQSSGNKHARSDQVKIKKINLFSDSGEKSKEQKEKDKKIYQAPITPRVRKSQMINFDCSECEETFFINSSLLKEDSETKQKYYICDDCEFRKHKK